jgi:hypothetical protein
VQSLKDENKKNEVWWAYFVKLMREQERWFDNPVKERTAESVRDELAGLAVEVLQDAGLVKGPASKVVGELRELIAVKSSSPNAG